jgi:hypothetical protein
MRVILTQEKSLVINKHPKNVPKVRRIARECKNQPYQSRRSKVEKCPNTPKRKETIWILNRRAQKITDLAAILK